MSAALPALVVSAALLASCEAPVATDDDGSLGREGGLVVSTVAGPSFVLRLADAARLGELDLGASARLVASRDGAVAFALSGQGAVVVDGGMRWSVHGSHYHVRAGRPRLLPHRLDVRGATGLVSARGRHVLFSPGPDGGRAGAAQLFEDDLPNDEVRLDRFDLGPSHAGVAAPVSGSVVASTVSDDAAGLVVHEKPTVPALPLDAACTGPRAAVSFHEAAVLACAEGLVRVGRDGTAWRAETVAWPEGATADALEVHAALPFAAGRTPAGLLRYEDAGRGMTHTMLGERPVRVGIDRGDVPRTLALLADGALQVVSSAGEASPRWPVEARADDGAPLAVGLRHAYVAARGGAEVLEVSLDDGRVTRRFPAPGAVAGLALVGHKWFNVPDHTVEH